MELKNLNHGKSLKSQKGLTLVEIILSIAIISILVIGFTATIGFNFKSVIHMGEKTKHIVDASEKADLIKAYIWSTIDNEFENQAEIINDEAVMNEIDEVLEANFADNLTDCSNLFDDPSKDWVFCYTVYNDKTTRKVVGDEEIMGYDFTIVVFYENNRYVKVEFFILYPERK